MAVDPQGMSDREFHGLAHPLLRRRYYLALVFSMLLFPLIALGLIFGIISLVVPLIALVLWIGMRVLFAGLIGNSIVVSELNFPSVDTIAEEMKKKIGFRGKVYIFVYESKSFNAFMRHVFFRHAIFLNSEMLVAGVGEDELRWIIGRFVGYLRARDQAGLLGMLIRAARRLVVFEIFLLPYERAMVYTGDRLALAAIGGDILTAATAMQKLSVGRELGYSINPEGLVAQLREVKGTFFGFLARIASGFPLNAARYVDLVVFAKQFYPARYVAFEAMNPGLPKDLGRLVALPRPDPKPGSLGLIADARPPRGWWVAAGMCAVYMFALFAIFTVVRREPYYEPSPSTQNDPAPQATPTPQGTPALQDTAAPPAVPAPEDTPVLQDSPAPQAVPAPQDTPALQDSPAPLAAPAPQDTPVLQDSPAPQATPAQPEAISPTPPGPHLHQTANGSWAPDPGCKWASENTKDLSVVCN